ncbi:MAG: hypothetical protein EP335_17445 [Alphaproteobacteria bacterium]|nr:MAG: hypothetical protein EP335_17445 [Alphaproteobacteria bacterium]
MNNTAKAFVGGILTGAVLAGGGLYLYESRTSDTDAARAVLGAPVTGSIDCAARATELTERLSELKEQLKVVPATIPADENDPAKGETVNRLYEQLMLETIEATTELQKLESCTAS